MDVVIDSLVSGLSDIGTSCWHVAVAVLPYIALVGMFALIGFGIRALLILTGKIW